MADNVGDIAAREEGDLLVTVGDIVDEDETHFLVLMPGFEPELVAKADGWKAVTIRDLFEYGQAV